MKYIASSLFALLFLFGCGSDDDATQDQPNLPAQTLTDVSYGPDAEQKLDVYLPADRTSDTKVFVLVHGGGWTEGSRTDMGYVVPALQAEFPDYAIVNLDYRLGTDTSPAFPKQIDDIALAIQFIQNAGYQISDDYGFIGVSAGAHLSLLYSYKYDPDHEVKAVCSIVGPTDFTDPAYIGNPVFEYGLTPLIGNVSYDENPELFAEVSPATHVSSEAPVTVMFYGGQDPLIPVSQATRLKSKLDEAGVYNEYYLYPEGGHGDWDLPTMIDFQTKLIAFFEARF
ncbi:alpha/beta hydrolase [Flavobacterium silvaticum]|uniref:Alpha/beta hydrolase n=1 Tax=Flavobacterium silvaticum TaxID=1852020 RepID=A0A972JK55_9FLAO|nr:alpha/beta hydrolase [Flavobacterium silvaticum]NMH28797.1 alpha/beta hydrolase [Flavobacterium silvaticum]